MEETSEDETTSHYAIQLPIAGESELGKRLDKIFPKDEVERLLELTQKRNWTDNHKTQLDKKLYDFINQITQPKTFRLKEPELEHWWGGVKNDDSCNQWIKLVKELLEGDKKGKALLLNGGTNSSLSQLAVNDEHLAVLLDREWSQSEPQTIPVPKSQLTKLGETDLNQNQADKKKSFNLIGITSRVALMLLLTGLAVTQLTLFSRIETIENDLKILEQKQNQITTLSSQIEELENNLESRLDQEQKQITTLSSTIEELEDKIAQIEPIQTDQTIVNENEEISWELLSEEQNSTLSIQGKDKREEKLEQVCILLVKEDEKEFYVSGERRVDPNNCDENSLSIPEANGTWNFKSNLTDPKFRRIRVEKIYKDDNAPKHYIDFIIAKNN